jgi:predicted RNA polymerase sigma factor
MRLYDPTSSGPQKTLFRAPALASLEGRTIGVLENGKLNAEEMLRELAALFAARHGCMLRPIYSKSNASAPAPAGILAQAAAEVDFLITGLGD